MSAKRKPRRRASPTRKGRRGRRSFENPSTPLGAPDEWLYDALGAGRATSGVRVGVTGAFSDSPWWRGIDLKSSTVAKLPLFVYRRLDEGKARATEHPVYHLLRYRPNPWMTSLVWLKLMMVHRLVKGNGYSFIDWKGNGVPTQLVPMACDATHPVRANGELLYFLQTDNGDAVFEPWQVLHFKGMSWDGLEGMSVIAAAKEALGWGLAAREHSTRFFRNAARGGLLLEHPQTMDEEAQKRFVAAWEQRYAGVENAHRTVILEEGMKASKISWTPQESQFIETVSFHVRDIANFIGIPPHRLGDTTRTSFASLEQENQSFLDDVDPDLVMIELECREKLLTETQKRTDSHVIEFMREALVRADLAARGAFYSTALGGAPFMSRNEVRAQLNLNGVPGGDEIPQGPSGQPAPGAKPADPDPVAGDADEGAMRSIHLRIVGEAESRMVRRLCAAARKAARSPDTFGDWLEGFRGQHESVVRHTLEHPVLALCGGDGASEPELARRVEAVFSAVREACDGAYGASPGSEFPKRIEAALSGIEGTKPADGG